VFVGLAPVAQPPALVFEDVEGFVDRELDLGEGGEEGGEGGEGGFGEEWRDSGEEDL
jgi:hypothetical protein